MTGLRIDTGGTVPLTSDGSGGQHNGLEPHRKEVHDGEVRKCNQEIADPDEDGDFLC